MGACFGKKSETTDSETKAAKKSNDKKKEKAVKNKNSDKKDKKSSNDETATIVVSEKNSNDDDDNEPKANGNGTTMNGSGGGVFMINNGERKAGSKPGSAIGSAKVRPISSYPKAEEMPKPVAFAINLDKKDVDDKTQNSNGDVKTISSTGDDQTKTESKSDKDASASEAADTATEIIHNHRSFGKFPRRLPKLKSFSRSASMEVKTSEEIQKKQKKAEEKRNEFLEGKKQKARKFVEKFTGTGIHNKVSQDSSLDEGTANQQPSTTGDETKPTENKNDEKHSRPPTAASAKSPQLTNNEKTLPIEEKTIDTKQIDETKNVSNKELQDNEIDNVVRDE